MSRRCRQGRRLPSAEAQHRISRDAGFIYIDAAAMVRALSGPALDAHYVTNGIAHARLLAKKLQRLRARRPAAPRTEAIIGAAAITALQQFNFTKAFIGANGVALNVGFTTPTRRRPPSRPLPSAAQTWYLVDDSKFGRVYPAVIEIYGGAILTNRCPEPKYKQLTLVKETEQ